MNSTVWTIVGVLAIIALLILVIRWLGGDEATVDGLILGVR